MCSVADVERTGYETTVQLMFRYVAATLKLLFNSALALAFLLLFVV